MAHSNPNKYIICLQDAGLEKTCPSNDCYDELNPPCSSACPQPNAAALALCNDPNVKPLERMADPADCEQYYLCMGNGNDHQRLRCPSNKHYSEKEKKCMDVFEANCAVTTKWCQNKRNGTTFAAANCFEYYECEGQETFKLSCPLLEHFDSDVGKCITGACEGDTRRPNCENISDGTRLPHSKCYMYFVCLNKALYEAQCGSGYYFDVKAAMCVRDVNNVCNDS